MGLVQTTAPAIEPVTLEEVRFQVRFTITDAATDTSFETLIEVAREFSESETGRQLINATYELTLDAFPNVFILPKPPLVSVSSIEYTDANGDSQILDTSVYDEDTTSTPGRIVRAYNQSWPTTRASINSVKVTYVAGYGEYASDVPVGIKQAMLMLIGHWHDNRESVVLGVTATVVPMAVTNLLNRYKLVEIY